MTSDSVAWIELHIPDAAQRAEQVQRIRRDMQQLGLKGRVELVGKTGIRVHANEAALDMLFEKVPS